MLVNETQSKSLKQMNLYKHKHSDNFSFTYDHAKTLFQVGKHIERLQHSYTSNRFPKLFFVIQLV